jgi:Putative Flp pilus-assembly TadE/G-like
MATSTYMAISLPILLGFAALSIDLSLIGYEKSNLQMASDSAALAAAEYLGTQTNDLDAIHQESVSIGSSHFNYGAQIQPQQITTEVGDFTSDGDFFLNSNTGNYVRVTVQNPELPPIFGGLFGYNSYNVYASSIAGKVETTVNECVPVMDNDWPCLIFATQSLEMSGNFDLRIDSPLENASVCTNSDTITLGGSLDIQNGVDLHMGPGCTSGNGVSCITSHGGAYNFNGDTTPLGMEVSLPSVEYPDDYRALPNGVRVGGRNGGTVTTISTGETYFVDGDLTMTRNQSINISGASNGCTDSNGNVNPATIYVNGNVNLSGGVAGNIDHPECFEIKVIGERTVRINGSTAFYGNIYAPDSEVYPNGNASFYGTLMVGTLRANGNNDIILDSSQSGSVPNGSDEMDCEEQDIVVSQLRLLK